MKFLTHEDKDRITQAIMAAEKMTSGELRVHVEKKPGKTRSSGRRRSLRR